LLFEATLPDIVCIRGSIFIKEAYEMGRWSNVCAELVGLALEARKAVTCLTFEMTSNFSIP
jgi:hypothetical protein